jgi:uncharacterized protein YqhQ
MDKLTVGGQAVIEGVMMRAPHAMAIAVRKPGGEVVVREETWRSFSQGFPFLKWPFIRGSVVLMETLINGVQALSFSASQALDDGSHHEKLNSWALAGILAAAFGIGILFFIILPHYLTGFIGILIGRNLQVRSVLFHFVDGLIKVAFLVGYIGCISRMKDIRRIFQYHGAEHLSIHAYEAGEDLTVSNARKYSTLHPRCGTAFLLVVFVISILTFSVVFPLLPDFSPLGRGIANLIQIGMKLLLLIPIGGIAYEFIKLTGKKSGHPFWRLTMTPGLWLQRLTTEPPTDDQIEIALRALLGALKIEGQQIVVL